MTDLRTLMLRDRERHSAIRDAATALAARYSGTRARDLRHIAMDAQAAIDGCPASAQSVADWLAEDHELLMLALASAEYVGEAVEWAEAAE